MLNSKEPIKVDHLQKLVNQSVLNSALLTDKCLTDSFSESKKNFCHLIGEERLKYIYIYLLDSSYLEVKKKPIKVVNA